MRLFFVSASLALISAHAFAGESSYYLDIVNDSADSMQTLSIAMAGSDRYIALPLGDGALHGGGETATLRLRSDTGSCLRNIRMTFVTGYTLVQRDVNVCHRQRLTVKRGRSDDARTASKEP